MTVAATLSVEALRSLPKVALHDHLDGGVRPQTILDLAELTLSQDSGNSPAELLQMVTAPQAGSSSLAEYLVSFDAVTSLLRSAEALERVAFEAVTDLAQDGVFHAEIRFAPELYARHGVNLEEATEAVVAGVRRGAQTCGVSAGLILCALRHTAHSMDIAMLAARRHKRSEILGFDVAGDEARYSINLHREAVEHCVANDVPVTIHAGEADSYQSVQAALDAASWQCRIGHGVALADPAASALLRKIVRFQVPLEVCPSSNVQTGAALSDDCSQLRVLRDSGALVTISCDNRTQSGVTMSSELRLVCERLDLSVADLVALQRSTARASWCSTATGFAFSTRLAQWESLYS